MSNPLVGVAVEQEQWELVEFELKALGFSCDLDVPNVFHMV